MADSRLPRELPKADVHEKPFQLIGSLRIDGDVEEIIRTNREWQARLREKKWTEIFGKE